MNQTTNFSNHLLIAMPALQSPEFARSVTYICEHSADGAMGLVINRPSEFCLQDVLKQMHMNTELATIAGAQVLIGGPVQTERGFVLHDGNEPWESSVRVSDSLFVTTSKDVLAAIAKGHGPANYLVALGYAGWTAGQLEDEILQNSWLTVEANHKLLFNTALEKRWQAATALIGIDPSQLSDFSGHA